VKRVAAGATEKSCRPLGRRVPPRNRDGSEASANRAEGPRIVPGRRDTATRTLGINDVEA